MELVIDSGARLPAPAARASMRSVASNDLSDGELICLTAEGDGDAFEILYRRYARPMFGLALRRLGDRGRAEDAVQETFASIWRAAGSYRPERGPGGPWLYAVARNAIIDRSRARNEPAVEAPDTESNDPGPPELAERDWVAWRVHRALEELPESQRNVIELAYWSGLSQSEVATYLGIPLGTVKTRTRAALARLGDVLDDLEGSE